MNWKIVGIVAVGILCLVGMAGTVFAVYSFLHSFDVEASRSRCNSPNPDVSIAGCSAILQSSSADDSDRTYAYFQRGRSYERKGDWDRAIADDSEVIRRTPKEYLAWNNRGYAYQRKGELDRAIADYNRAIELEPEMVLARFNRGEAWNQKGDEQKAIDDFSGVIQLEPKNAVA